MATTLTQDLDSIKAVEDKLTTNQVAQFAYTQEAYNDPEHYADGVQAYNVNNPNNIPVADASILKVNETVLSKGYRSQASSITRMLLNHFLGRTSYNLNKANDLIKSLVTTIKNNLGQANGIATLDGNGRIPYSQLPESAIEFKGAWNAQTNTPQLADGTGTKGDFYVVSVAGTQNLGSGDIQFFVNDRVIYDGEVWQRLSAGDVKTVNNVQPVDGNITLTPSDIELGNVNNTSDMSKPVSTAQQTAIDNAIATAENLDNATGILAVKHGGTGADTTEGARTNLNINNVVNTGDSATPLENGLTKFTTGGAYAELLKKSNSYEEITIANLTPYMAGNDVELAYLLDTIQNNFPRYGRCGIAKFAEEEDYLLITFDEPSNLSLRTSGLLIIGVVGFPHASTSSRPSNDSVVLLVTKDLAVYTCRCTRNGSTVRSVAVQSQSSLVFDSTPTASSSNPVTSNGIKTAIDSAVSTAEDLDNATGILAVAHGGTGTNSFDTVPTAGSSKPVTSDGIKTAIDGRLPAVVNTGDSAVPEENGTRKFTTGGAFDFFQTEDKNTWLGRIFGKYYGAKWNIKSPSGTYPLYNRYLTTDIVEYLGHYYCGYNGEGSGLVELGQPSTSFYSNKSINDLKVIDDPVAGRVLLVATDTGIYAGLSSSTPLIDRPVNKLICLDIDGTPHLYALTYRRTGTTCYLELFEGYSMSSVTPGEKISIISSNAWFISCSITLEVDFYSSPTVTWDIINNLANDKLYFAYGIAKNNTATGGVYHKDTDMSSNWSIVTDSQLPTSVMDGALKYTKLICDYQGNVVVLGGKFKCTKFISKNSSTTAINLDIDSSFEEIYVNDCIALRAQTGFVKYLFATSSGLFLGAFITSTAPTITRTQVTLEDGSNPFSINVKCDMLRLTDDPEENRVIVCANGYPYVISNAGLASVALPLVSSIPTGNNTAVHEVLCHDGLIMVLCSDSSSNYYVYRYINNVSLCTHKTSYGLYKLIYIKGKWLLGDEHTLLHYSGYEEAVQAGLIPE